MLTERLKTLRNNAGLTQFEIAQELNITREAYALYETGRRQPSHETLCNIADFYQVNLDYLFCRTDISEPINKFSNEEYSLIKNYRALDVRGKENIQHMVKFEYNRLQMNTKNKSPQKTSQ